MAFSNGGGTLALPSPTSLHGDAGPSVRSLRRSLSRSPSRFHLMRGDSHNSQHSDSSSSSALPSPCPRPHTTTSTAVTAASTTPTHAPPLHHTSLSASSSASSISSEYNFTSSTPLATAATTAPASAFAPASAPVSTTLYYRDHSGPFSTPLRSGARLSLRSVRPKTVSAKPISRLRPSPKSPLKRALTTNSDLANASPSTTPQSAGPSTAFSEPLLGQENGISGGTKFSGLFFPLGSPPHDKMDKPSRHSVHLDTSGDSRLEALSSNVCSPLKRSDAIMSLDQVNPGSPVAKRRSLHGITSLGGEFNIFDFASPNPAPSSARSSFEIHDDSSSSNDQPASPTAAVASLSVAAAAGASSSFSSFSSFSSSLSSSPPTAPAPVADPGSPFSTPTVTKRTSSLRRSTLQQRHDPRSSWGRRQGEKYLAQQQQLLAQHLQQQQDQDQQDQQGAAVSSSPKITQQLKKASNDWLFTAPNVRSRPRASLDQLLKPEPRETPFKVKGPLANPSVHTLERPLGLASSTATHMHQPHPLSRTLTTSSSGSSMPDDSPTHFPVQLPPDRPRPTSIFARSLPLNAHRPRPDPIATPQYKSARPLQSVFASAGLVSKMNRNAEDDSLQQAGGRRMVMPDTPCKKQVYPSNTYPPSSGSGRKQQQRRFFFSAAPETPFNTSTGAGSGSGAAQPQNASASTSSTTSENVANFFKRRSTHARKGSILSLDGDISDSQCAVDSFDLPPTPTKSVLAKNLFGSASKGTSTPIAVRDLPTGPLSFTPDAAPPRRSPLPLSSPVGSLGSEKMSPKTPREHNIFSSNDFLSNMAPPDASRLSISNNNSNNSNNNNASKLGVSIPANRSSSMIFPPATPTADREAFASFVDRRVSITPVHGAAPKDADVVLGSMFGKVECVGKGEFSQVFRVNTRDSSVYGRGPLDYFSTTPSKRASSARAEITPTPSLSASGSSSGSALPRVFAVKKVRLPYFGQREREAKLREVAALEAVRDCENVLQIFDHWEQNGHLYIQTEYCDEGGMDGFLKKVGEHGRLDDFRIWKILLEVSQGLRFVHDAGFIHLDLKPANIFVTYEGHLKIGDFGMAATWPAPKGIEGEGDREYMGPEILQGRYDKPADVFALGLIVLEIACNVFLPDNGPIWVALREGDMSVVPSLTAGEANALVRDSAGMPIVGDFDTSSQDGHSLADSLDLASTTPGRNPPVDFTRPIHTAGNLFGSLSKKPVGLEHPPAFMTNASLPGSLDSIVACLINPDPERRPTVHEILEIDSLQWVFARRRAPATIFEGNWGPEDDDESDDEGEVEVEAEVEGEGEGEGEGEQTSPVAFDTEMMDV